jgi:hypothetical protein
MDVEELLARECIRDTLARYNIAGDRLRLDDFVAVFTEDGVLESDDRGVGTGFHSQGREAIRAWMGGSNGPTSGRARLPKFVRHHLTTCQIDLTGPDTATGRTYWCVYTDVGPDHAGQYIDVFRKIGERWLIAHRKARTDWFSPDSLFRPTE